MDLWTKVDPSAAPEEEKVEGEGETEETDSEKKELY